MAFCSKRGAKLAQVVSQPVVSPMVMVGNSGVGIAALMPDLLGFPIPPLAIGTIICGA